uniref:Uncharacterized protein n=1 Tax=Chromera velia CCMP2878 TaxID=1169474 RepID=A0A0G4I3F1_9ALVE|eukprot:Cvel_35449.t1-p1 / transcript=Cvel_35449.t1 / gene=Cvel_35449 / organism=Chromera_velia_CCMP2878 / gene_product=hypothetical protein / transcript_product=hypothetical protein / location=Cvel_scaffold6480:1785-2210(+) / protein_length=142 / sequence_SO=supercontig / SO=protein_coding / is_pseudo=false
MSVQGHVGLVHNSSSVAWSVPTALSRAAVVADTFPSVPLPGREVALQEARQEGGGSEEQAGGGLIDGEDVRVEDPQGRESDEDTPLVLPPQSQHAAAATASSASSSAAAPNVQPADTGNCCKRTIKMNGVEVICGEPMSAHR